MEFSEAERHAMRRALELAATPGVPLGPNPRVGCVLLDAEGAEVAEGYHRGAGTAHAEVAALVEAGSAARGTTAVVTTGPCTEALIEAGVARVVFAQPDPNELASGGEASLRAAGVDVAFGLLEREARALNRAWTFAMEHHRPYVSWKLAATLDGRSAAADGSSRWITGEPARRDVHRLRAQCDAILVGTATVERDDPQLTVRDEVGEPVARGLQPLRVVMGTRDLPAGRRVFDDLADTVQLRTHDPAEVVAELHGRGRQHLFLEGGPTVAAAFLRAGLVDEVVAYVAPKLLGAGVNVVGALDVDSIGEALDLKLLDVTRIGDDVRLTLQPGRQPAPTLVEPIDSAQSKETR
jgi:diaminohydroxyphosphoribosylaminopyrimidine deaminase/5-amino-6-(5-phosphoribosylamino)uracil reductase